MSDRIFRGLLLSFGIVLLLLLIGLFTYLWTLSAPILQISGFSFYTNQIWDPSNEQFGALAFIYGTLLSSGIALIVAIPLSLCVALFLTQFASEPIKRVFGFLVEMLAAIPSVIYGLWGLFIFAPYLNENLYPAMIDHLGPGSSIARILGVVGTALSFPLVSLWNMTTSSKISTDQIYNFFDATFEGPSYGVGLLTAGMVLAVMIIPTVTSICREVFKTIPAAPKEAALALGSTRWEMIRMVVLRGSRSGIAGAVILGLGRALGETMAVTMLIGNRNSIEASLFAPAQTMASIMANEYQEASDLHLSALAAVGFGLLIVSLSVNLLARAIVWYSKTKMESAR